MKPKVYINKPIPQEVEEYIAGHCDYRKSKEGEKLSKEQFHDEIKDVEGILTAGGSVDQEFLQAASNLKVVSNMSVGYNNFNLEEMKKRNVIGTNTPYVLDNAVADLAFGLMIATARKIPELNNYVKNGGWKGGDDTPLFGLNVHSTTLGIIGMGRIGQVVARRAIAGFNMDVLYHNRKQNLELEDEIGVTYKNLEGLLKESDFVLLLLPLNEQTKHYFTFEHFKLMKKTGIFINISRGQTVNENALVQALWEREIAAAGLDVFDQEPTSPDNPLLSMDNVVALPHIGTATHKTRADIAMLAAKNLVDVLINDGKSAYIVPELR
ncbi:2-hydroxyacid dehydrogenase [Virgibacillus doumboii]|uniref:2-hydroxyacid dehydrogenase n=1 Tax=Virgibacillus doumboii TaxID=2697503 RepID=UPI0013DEF346|nr:D-glycerate dehydrogenase [Virgibacillus doumboii]